MLGLFTFWPQQQRHKYESSWRSLSRFDFVGNLLLIVASILLVFAIQEGATAFWKWSSPTIIWSLVISGVCWIVLCVWESYLFYGGQQNIQPVFPLRLVTGPVYLSSFV